VPVPKIIYVVISYLDLFQIIKCAIQFHSHLFAQPPATFI